MGMEVERDERTRQVVVAVMILVLVMGVTSGLILGWRFMPGLLGEWVGVIVGVISTPVFLEASFFIVGLVIVIAINHWREVREGDEWVTLELETPAAEGDGHQGTEAEGER